MEKFTSGDEVVVSVGGKLSFEGLVHLVFNDRVATVICTSSFDKTIEPTTIVFLDELYVAEHRKPASTTPAEPAHAIS